MHIKVSIATVHWSIRLKVISLANTRAAEVNLTSHITVMRADNDASREILRFLSSRQTVYFSVQSVPRMRMRAGLTGDY